MKRLLTLVAMLGLVGLGMNLSAQQTPSSSQSSQSSSPSSAQTPSSPSDNSSMPQSSQTSTNSQQSARSFEGKIQKSGDKLVLQDSASQTSYQLDDQDKAKQFEGKTVKVMGTVDSASNTLHIIDISPASESK